MKGVILIDFLEMVEKQFGNETVDKIILRSNLPSKGIYAAVSSYDHTEMYLLISELSKHANIEVPELIKIFGKYLFSKFTKSYPQIFNGNTDLFGFLTKIEDTIHVEVQKLYPDAQLPKFETKILNPNQLEMVYKSDRKLAMLALGLVNGAIKYFKEEATVEIRDLSKTHNEVKLIITK